MAWTHFPIQAGLWGPPAEVLNELRDAMTERGITPPAEYHAGQWLSHSQYLVGLRNAVATAVASGNWYWVESYTDSTNYNIWQLTMNATSLPWLKNVFELALGEGITAWRTNDSAAEDLNDISRVLNRLIYKDGTWPAVGLGVAGVDWKVGNIQTTPAAALAACDATAWIVPYISAPPSLHAVRLSPSSTPGYWFGELFRRFNGQTHAKPANAIRGYVSVDANAGRGVGGTLGRALTATVRSGGGGLPSTWSDASGWGSVLASFSLSGTSPQQTQVLVFDADVSLVYVAGAHNASGSGLTGSGSDYQEWATVGRSRWFSEMNYTHR